MNQSMSSLSHPRLVDLIIRAGIIYPMTVEKRSYAAIALKGDCIVALSEKRDGLDELIFKGTKIIDDPKLILLPALNDSHCHLTEASRNMMILQLDKAKSIDDIIRLIRERAITTAPGQWIVSANNWNEQDLLEKRFPLATELDQATAMHPVVLRRGGHLIICNSVALQLGGVTPDISDPPGGTIERRPDGSLSGLLMEGPAKILVERLVPLLSFEEKLKGISIATAAFASAGIGSVRDPMVSPDDVLVYQAAKDKGLLSVRVRILVSLFSMKVAERIDMINKWYVRSGFGDDMLRIWGLKFLLDGGAEGGALEESYLDRPQYFGHLMWKTDELVEMFDAAVKRNWKIATHAVGDLAVRTLIDAYERIIQKNPNLPKNSLVIEHAFLVDLKQRSRAIRLSIPVTVQHSLLYTLGAEILQKWGAQRLREVMPVKAWLEEGATIAAGTDYPAGSWDPMECIWGMVTRQTKGAGIQGPEYAVDPYTAVRLYTSAGPELEDEGSRLGKLLPGQLADIVAFRTDPFKCHVDELRFIKPVFTLVGGRAVFDSEKFFT
jgi:predicted amidohydrolase YtcJ